MGHWTKQRFVDQFGPLASSMPRLTLLAALLVPTLLVVVRDPAPERAFPMLAWSFLASIVVGTMPGRLFNLSLVGSWIGLPYTLWWVAYAGMNGVGPGMEAARAALHADSREVVEAAALVMRSPAIVLAAAAHLSLLVFATTLWIVNAPESRGNHNRITKLFLAGLVPLSLAICWQTADPNAPALMSPIDDLASPIGTAIDLSRLAIDEAVFGQRYKDGARRAAHEPSKVGKPILSILVVGESVRADALGPAVKANGPWTKALDDRVVAGLGARLPDTCASAHGTMMSVPMLLTGTDPEHKDDSQYAPSGLARLKAAGYITAWITNQDLTIFREHGHDYTWVGSIDFKYRYDEVLIPIARTIAGPLLASGASVERARGILIHVMGSHFAYEERYPGNLFPSEPAEVSRDELLELRYLRANEYGARTLMQVAEILDLAKVPAFAVYVSDHGENLPSDHNGLLTHLGPRTSKRDGTTMSLVLWNRQMADSGQPQVVLAKLVAANLIAHKDVYKVWMALSGLEGADIAVEPIADPKIWANPEVGSGYRPVSCSMLSP